MSGIGEKIIPMRLSFIGTTKTAEDGKAWLQGKFLNLNAKVNQNIDIDERITSFHRKELLCHPAKNYTWSCSQSYTVPIYRCKGMLDPSLGSQKIDTYLRWIHLALNNVEYGDITVIRLSVYRCRHHHVLGLQQSSHDIQHCGLTYTGNLWKWKK